METQEIEKILFYENKKEIDHLRLRSEHAKRDYDLLLKAYKPLGVPVEITSISQLFNLAIDPESFVRKAFVDQLPDSHEIIGKDGRPVKLKRSFLEDQLVIPDLTKLKDASLPILRSHRITDEKVTYFDLYQITEKGVEINEEELAQEIESYRRYTTNEEEVKRWYMIQELCDKLNEVRQYFGNSFTINDKVQDELRPVLRKGGKYVPNYQFIRPSKHW